MSSLDLLTEEERARIETLPHERRSEFGLSRVLARSLAAAALGTPRRRLRIGGPGRPRIEGAPRASELYLIISHTAGAVAAAVCDAPVGIDVETPIPEGAGRAAGRAFSPAERAWLASLRGEHAVVARTRLWTIKEAAGKARGTGLFPRPPAVATPLSERGTIGDLSWVVLDTPAPVAAAVAVPEHGGTSDRLISWRTRRRPAGITVQETTLSTIG